MNLPYDRFSNGISPPWVKPGDTLHDGTVSNYSGAQTPRVRSEEDRERCGEYVAPDGQKSWGDHRVTHQGTTCVEVSCFVNHHPDIPAGWSEPMDDFQERPGVKPIAAALYGWDGGGVLPVRIGDVLAWVAAHVALDALRDAGYEIVKKNEVGKEKD